MIFLMDYAMKSIKGCSMPNNNTLWIWVLIKLISYGMNYCRSWKICNLPHRETGGRWTHSRWSNTLNYSFHCSTKKFISHYLFLKNTCQNTGSSCTAKNHSGKTPKRRLMCLVKKQSRQLTATSPKRLKNCKLPLICFLISLKIIPGKKQCILPLVCSTLKNGWCFITNMWCII